MECNPVFYAYLLLEGRQKATLFTRADRLNDEAAEQLHLRRIDVRPMPTLQRHCVPCKAGCGYRRMPMPASWPRPKDCPAT